MANENRRQASGFSREEIEQKRAKNTSSKATAALVLGICSIVFCVAPFMLVAAVVGLMLEKDSEKTGTHSFQKPAKVLCIIGIVLCSLVIIAILAVVFTAGILSVG